MRSNYGYHLNILSVLQCKSCHILPIYHTNIRVSVISAFQNPSSHTFFFFTFDPSCWSGIPSLKKGSFSLSLWASGCTINECNYGGIIEFVCLSFLPFILRAIFVSSTLVLSLIHFVQVLLFPCLFNYYSLWLNLLFRLCLGLFTRFNFLSAPIPTFPICHMPPSLLNPHTFQLYTPAPLLFPHQFSFISHLIESLTMYFVVSFSMILQAGSFLFSCGSHIPNCFSRPCPSLSLSLTFASLLTTWVN